MSTIVRQTKTEDIKAAGEVLKQGGIVAFPTDTVYGLGAVFDDEKAVRKIFAAKGREEKKPLSILVADIVQVELLSEIKSGEMAQKAERLMKKYWPGALTLIFQKKPGIPDAVTAGGETIGIRMPDMELTRELIRAAGKPLAAPSANTSGKRSSVSAREVLEDLDGKIDMVIDGGTCPVGVASTVVDMTGDTPVILREGVITAEMIAQA
ncbi:MAG: threonylcarbamoyl-AMP synthase [Lachnospiraceae bacterium]|nr:threonylcarbamoyl-AMP synthase [Lachnospiraceae bacterium]MBR6357543.1 threonylcarbamoyl-AMP synthase [Lachnospiraceae bacterium]